MKTERIPTIPRKSIFAQLYVQVLIGVALGIALGLAWPGAGAAMKPFGDGFIKLIKMIITPVVFCTVVIGIGSLGSMRRFGKIGALSLIYFQIVTTMALVVGLVSVNLLRPGSGMNIDPASLDSSQVDTFVKGAKKFSSATDFIMNIIPANPVSAFAEGDILQVLFLAILFGAALSTISSGRQATLSALDTLQRILFRIIDFIMKLAPIGAFGAIAFTVGKYGLGTLLPLGKLVLAYYATCLVFIIVVFGLIARAHGLSLVRIIRYLRDELVLVLGTSSSESALPRVLLKLERLGADPSIVGLTIPIGYSFNLTGNALYFTMASMFLAQATGTPISLGDQILLVCLLTLTSKGAAGVTGGAFIVLAASLSAVGHIPVAGLALILGVNRFLSEAGSLTNTIGNALATLVVAKWCGMLDSAAMDAELSANPVGTAPAAPVPAA